IKKAKLIINTKLNIDNNQRASTIVQIRTKSLFKEGNEKTLQEGDYGILIVTLIEEKKLKSIKLADVKQNLGKYQTSLQQELLKHIKVDDHVRLMGARTGKIKYIALWMTNFDMIDIEMESWNPSGHNGKDLFTAADDHGDISKSLVCNNYIIQMLIKLCKKNVIDQQISQCNIIKINLLHTKQLA
ncbi:hypothetical protein RFI_22972, partial [Reticulomyxa filosa]